MPKYDVTRRMPFSARQMFDLVADVEKYPEFVPMCEALKLRGRQEQPDGRAILVADMSVGYGAIRETFTSRVTLDAAASTILVEYLQGPFKHLQNRWTFVPEGEAACTVKFFIDYEFKSRLLSAVMGAVFDKAFRKLTSAFEARAAQIYGTRQVAG
jgi:coenzyme Q-binding protein COQ10